MKVIIRDFNKDIKSESNTMNKSVDLKSSVKASLSFNKTFSVSKRVQNKVNDNTR